MATLSPSEIYQVCIQAGFEPNQAVTWTAIALAESGGNTQAHNPNGEDSWGLWQINVGAGVRENKWGDLTDPLNNARAAFEISGGGTNMRPWTVTHDKNAGSSRDYRNYLDEASAAAGGIEGDGSGVAGYGGGPSQAGGGADDDVDIDIPAGGGVDAFLQHARSQAGDRYVFGAEAEIDDANPDTFDCSELVQWAAGQVGVEVPDGSWIQYLTLKEQGAVIPVEEALNTPGALLFSFSSDPTAGGGRPSSAHVAISLGDGTTIEARGTKYGVGEWDAGDRFAYAAVIPELAAATPSPPPVVTPPAPEPSSVDTDADGLDDTFEMSLGTDPTKADTDRDGLLDGFEQAIGTNATLLDTDADGLTDGYELSRSHTDALSADTDMDGVSDGMELAAGTDPGQVVQMDPTRNPAAGAAAAGTEGAGTFGVGSAGDADADGLIDAREQAMGTDANVADSDADGLNDGLEFGAGTNPLLADSDHDGLSDPFELSLGTDPTNPDTDMDGLLDGAAMAVGADPGQAAPAGVGAVGMPAMGGPGMFGTGPGMAGIQYEPAMSEPMANMGSPVLRSPQATSGISDIDDDLEDDDDLDDDHFD